ncbi:50S ribosomal protein L9 [Dehalococcoidia bacterium]|nr:50S ribosomal protein L9 [Dehalococcoidia bacterium]
MRVVFLEDVPGVAQGGDVKEVKNGFARNYLIPKSLAVPATHNALQRVEKLSRSAGVGRIKLLEDMKQLAETIEGTQVNVEMRAGSSGRLYGSVTNTTIAETLSELTTSEIDRRTIKIAEPIRELGVYDLNIRLHPDVNTTIKVVVHPTGTNPMEIIEAAAASEAADEQSDEESPRDVVETSQTAESALAEDDAPKDEEK